MLYSIAEISGYNLLATDGEIGKCKDFLFDDGKWTVRYLMADTRNWLPGRKVLLTPKWIQSVDWPQGSIHVGLLREAVKNSPEFDPDAVLSGLTRSKLTRSGLTRPGLNRDFHREERRYG